MPLMHAEGTGLSIALTFRAVLAKQNSTDTLDLVPALAGLNTMNEYEYEYTL